MIDNVDISDGTTLTISTDDDLYATIDVSNTTADDSQNISITLNSQNNYVDYTHSTISLLSSSSSVSSSDGCSSNCEELISDLKEEISEALDNYLLKELFYEYTSNFSDAIKYISYLESNDLLYTPKTFVTQKGFVMYYDDSEELGDDSDSDGDNSSGGTYYHDQLQNLDVANQHPISAITGLTSALNLKLDSSSISSWALSSTKPSYAWDEITDKPNVYTDQNANLFTVDWKVNHLYAAQSVVMFANGSDVDSDSDSEGGSGGTYYHDQLQNLDVANQHPISAITGLTSALNLKLDSSSISSWALASTKPSYSYSELTDVPTSFQPKSTSLTDVTDLNDVMTVGFYYCYSSSTASSMANTPNAIAFCLMVERHAGYKQTFTTYSTSSPTTYVRNYYSGTWGSWYIVYTSNLSYTYITGLTSALNLKLDSSSYTAADVLSKLLNVDGSGSGLDADLLDGYDSSEYYRIGTQLYNGPELYISDLTAVASDTNCWNNNSNTSLKIVNSNNALAITVGGVSNDRQALLQVGHSSTTYSSSLGTLHLNKLGGNVLINGYTAYHSGNSNLSTIDWACKNLTAAGAITAGGNATVSGNVTAGGTVVMYSTT